MDSLAFLDNPAKAKPQPVYVVTGDEDFLKRQVVMALRQLLLGDGDDAFGYSAHDGDRAVWSTVHDELHTLPFLGGRRLVVVDGADPFVTEHRSSLEKYVASPAATGVLVLVVKSWPGNTRLAKLIDQNGTIVCEAPAGRLPEWCVRRCLARHGKQLAAPAARLLVDLIGPEMGLLDQELAKLATYVGEAARIDTRDVDCLVGNSREEEVWTIFNAIGAGKVGEALTVLDRLFEQGNAPQMILGAFSYQMRLMAGAARLHSRGKPLPAALAELGIRQSWRAERVIAQMRHLGQRRLARLYDWLLEIDLGIKGGSQLPERVQFERLIVRLARKNP